MPNTQQNINKKTGFCQSLVSRVVADLHKSKKCFIVRWKKGKQGKPMAVFKAGEGKDAVCNVVPLTRLEISRRFVARSIKSGHMKVVRERNNSAARTKRLMQEGDTLINALFGRPRERKAA